MHAEMSVQMLYFFPDAEIHSEMVVAHCLKFRPVQVDVVSVLYPPIQMRNIARCCSVKDEEKDDNPVHVSLYVIHNCVINNQIDSF